MALSTACWVYLGLAPPVLDQISQKLLAETLDDLIIDQKDR